MDPEPPPVLSYRTPGPEPRDRTPGDRSAAFAAALFCWVPTITGVAQSINDRAEADRGPVFDRVGVLLLVAAPVALLAAGVVVRVRHTVSRRHRRFLVVSLAALVVVSAVRVIESL